MQPKLKRVTGTLLMALLWLASAATEAQTPELVLDIRPGSQAGVLKADQHAVQGGAIYFVGRPSIVQPPALWRSDGTAAGTWAVPDAGDPHNAPDDIVAVGSSLVFLSAEDDAGDRELWATDGATIWQVLDINSSGSSDPDSFVELGGIAMFFADDGVNGRELWRSDGTAIGTWMVADLEPGPTGSTPSGLARLGSAVFFAVNLSGSGTGFWRSDGTAGGTFGITGQDGLESASAPISPLPGSDPPVAFFRGNSGSAGLEPWLTDGTDLGTFLIMDTCPGFSSCAASNLVGFKTRVAGGALWEGISSAGAEPWVSDGTELGTFQLLDIEVAGSSAPEQFVPTSLQVFFTADRSDTGRELWRTDGTTAGTWLVRDIWAGTSDSAPYRIVTVGSEAIFTARDAEHGWEFWRSDGTELGTQMVADLILGVQPTSIQSRPFVMDAIGQTVFLFANDGTSGGELWTVNLSGSLFADGFETGSTGAWSAATP